jgi:hypothetical protein
VHNVSWLPAFWIAFAMVFIGAFVFWRESRRGRRQQAFGFVIGVPGVCLWTIGQLEDIHVLWIPGIALVLAGYVVQHRAIKKSPTSARPRRRVLGGMRQTKTPQAGEPPEERHHDES